MSSVASELVMFDAQLKEERDYWLARLTNIAKGASLASDFEGPIRAVEPASVQICIRGRLYERLIGLTNGSPFLIYTALMAALKVCLHRQAGDGVVIVGSPALKELGRANSLAILDIVHGKSSFREVLTAVRSTLLDAYRSQRYPYDYLLRDLDLNVLENRCPLFDVGLAMTGLHGNFPGLMNDLTITFADDHDKLTGVLEFNKLRWRRETIQRFGGHYLNLLREGLEAIDAPILTLPMLTADEHHQLVVEWNDTSVEFPEGDRSFLSLFASQILKQRDALALVYEEHHLTYDELNRRANQLSRFLRRAGVGPEVCVGLFLERSPDIVIGLLAILKAGGAYVPIDTAYPRERISFVIQNTQMPVLLSQSRLLDLIPGHAATVMCTDSLWEDMSRESDYETDAAVDPDNLAYVYYTSGSTGTPKGVMITHGGLANYLRWAVEAYEVSAGRGAPAHSPIAFDLTITALLAPLAAGTTAFLVSEEDPLTGLADIIRRTGGMSLIKLTPSHLDALTHLLENTESAGSTRALVVGGEALFAETLRWWRTGNSEIRVINEYGPTETVVGCCVYEMPLDNELKGPVSIGRPISNSAIYLLDAQLRPAALGITAELYIGGTGLARGYLEQPAITAGSFVPNPFSAAPGKRLYRTGDIARHDSTGNIQYAGRCDHQVKIRGHRIELMEIEAVLSEHPYVAEAVAIVREDLDGRKQLIAYLVGDQPQPAVEQLREYLRQRLPDYSIPTGFVLLDRFPLTSNGKVDRDALRELDRAGSDLKTAFLPPRSFAEQTLAKVWAQVLGIERIGINDNFFELGGDSILSIQVVARAADAGLRLNPRQLFRHQTIAELAQVAEATVPRTDEGPVTGSAPLTPIQCWFFEHELSDLNHFNQAVLLEVSSGIGRVVVETAINAILGAHDALRLRFLRDGRSWYQTAAGDKESNEFLALDLSALSQSERAAAVTAYAAQLQTSLDLSAGPLLRVAFFEMGAGSPARLLFIIHHLVVDGVSWRILLEDFQSACRQLADGHPIEFPAKTTSYQRWARSLEKYAKSNELKPELEYWLTEGQKSVPLLPLDYPDGINTVESSRIVTVTLSVEETRLLLQQVPQCYRSQINEVLLTAVTESFLHWTGSTSIRLDLEGHGREELFDDLDLTRTVGWFTASFPVRLELSDAGETGANLRSIKEQLRAVPGRGIGYGLLRYLAPDPEIREQLRGLAPAQISFNYFGQFDQALAGNSPLATARESTGPARALHGVRGFLLEISGSVAGGQLRMNWMYSENVHRRSTIQALADGFVESLRSFINLRGSIGTGSYVASDFPLGGLRDAEFRNVLSTVRHDGRIDDIYPLSPLQQGLLFHSLYAPQSGAYIAQMLFKLTRLNTHAFTEAWQRMVERHGVFRTAFIWKNLENAIQLVVGSVRLTFAYQDWRELSADEQQRLLDSYLETDRRRAFDLTAAPLIRFALFRATEKDWHFVWTHHHLLLDGWSMSLVAKELFSLYESFCQGKGIEPRTARPYRDYIAYLQGQDIGAAEAYWRRALKGSLPSVFNGDQSPNGSTARVDGHAEHRVRLSRDVTASVRAWGRQHRLTINTLVQGAWAMVLGHCLGSREVLFGTVVSGRPASLTGIESMVGLFINTLTVRTKLEPDAMLVSWLDDIQHQQAEMQQYDYASLVEVHEWSALPRSSPMFDSILVVENYPVEESIATDSQGVGVQLTGIFERLNYPMTIVVTPGQELSIKIVYDNVRFSESMIDRIGRHIGSSLGAFIKQDDMQISALQEVLQRIETDELDERRTRLAGAFQSTKRKPITQSPRPA